MGDYGVNLFGTGSKFDYNEIYESNYKPDPAAAAQAGQMVGHASTPTSSANAFVNDSPGRQPIWLDNGKLRHAHLGQLLRQELFVGDRQRDRLQPEHHGQPLRERRLGKGLGRVRE